MECVRDRALTLVLMATERVPPNGRVCPVDHVPDSEPDAYATGQTLHALHVSGMLATDPVYRRGADFLLRTQLEDGTWFVRSRGFGFQPFAEFGFPHGKSQFISAAATSWAVMALSHTL
jgi:hypothetical protein